MNRRNFLKLFGFSGAAALTAPVFDLTVQKSDDQTADEINELLYFRGLRPCPHSHHSSDEDFARCGCSSRTRRARGFVCINPEGVICCCGERRRFFHNDDGFRIWRCGNGCEDDDLRAWLRREYGPASSVQFTANMKRPPKSESDYDRFLASLNERIKHVLMRDETTLKSIHIDPIEEIDGQGFRFVRLWVKESEQPLTWYHRY